MSIQLLRLEAINMAYIIDDTEDLSTRRGGGYMLLQAIRDVETKFGSHIKAISTGASIGLFSICNNKPIETSLSEQIKDFLANDKVYRHATFAITLIEGDDFRTLVEQSICNVRWHQMSSLNFTTCWRDNKKESVETICEIDEVRPAPINKKHKGKQTNLSFSVADRNTEGRNLRQAFYKKELEENELNNLLPDKTFIDGTESLSNFHKDTEGYKDIPFNLNGKMAVFYADGNSFGKIQQACDDSAKLKTWDTYIKSRRRELLADLLKFMQNTTLGKTTDDKLRFETLLWGGDEMLFLLPAWLGLEFTQKFFELTRNWKYPEESLTHAAGLVFASHAAPISQLQKLAKKFADNGKAANRTQNTVSWIVLESFDHAGDDMDNYWQRSGIAYNGWQQLLLTKDKLEKLRATITPLKAVLPRSAIVRVLRSLAADKAKEEIELLLRSYESVDATIKEVGKEEEFNKLWKMITHNKWQKSPETIPPEDAVAWTLLMELWDYILPDANFDSTEGNQ